MTEEIEEQNCAVVGIGASAGGLQALIPVISGIKPRGKCAYVLAHHLSPDKPCSLVELVQSKCPLSVLWARDGDELVPDHVYMCPPGHNIELVDNHWVVSQSEDTQAIAPSIDRLFRSIAESRQEKAIVVVLSGSGHDGALGAEAVAAADGLVILQNPADAVHSEMPESVIKLGFADLVGSSQQIAEWLNHIDSIDGAIKDEVMGSANAFSELIRLVHQMTGLDVNNYKEGTLRRQAFRRFRSLEIKSLEHYVDYVKEHSEELSLLQQRFMVSVSSFFRDDTAFAALEAALRIVVNSKSAGDSIRVWVPGCSTGEEPYSIAMILAEILGDRLSLFEVRVFATDIRDEAIEFSRAGVYSSRDMVGLSLARQQRWFKNEGSGWRIQPVIRELCIFSTHNIIHHPPFINMDLVSCRNLLIYFKPAQQSDLINAFHYALKPDGLLFLGKSESVGLNSPLFEVLDGSNKLYRHRAVASRHVLRYSPFNIAIEANRTKLNMGNANYRHALTDLAINALIREYAPGGVLINDNFEPLRFFGNGLRFFGLPEESSDFTVFSLCLPELRNELKALCFRLMQDNLNVAEGVTLDLHIDGATTRVRPKVTRVEQTPASHGFGILITFIEIPPIRLADKTSGTVEQPYDEMEQIRRELADSRELLHSVINQLESANTELQILREEVQCSSEELQASNEELQASNEELTTLNDELRIKSVESAQLNATLTSIQNSLRSSLVLVDKEGHVTRYNAFATRVFGLVPDDIGQFLYGIPCHIPIPKLRDYVTNVVASGDSLVEQIHHKEFHFLMQIDPFENEVGDIAGAVLSFSDISELYSAEEAQRNIEARFRLFMDNSSAAAWIKDEVGRYVYLNKVYEQRFRVKLQDWLGKTDFDVWPKSVAEQLHANDLVVMQTGQALEIDETIIEKDGSEQIWHSSKFTFCDVEGRCYIAGVATEVTSQRLAERVLRESEQRVRLAMDAVMGGSWEWELATNRNYWSDELWGFYNLPYGSVEPCYASWLKTVHPDDIGQVEAIYAAAIARSESFEAEWRVLLPAGQEPRWLMCRGRPLLNDDGSVIKCIGVVIDISARKKSEEQLRKNVLLEEELNHLQGLLDSAFAGYWDWNIPKGTEYFSDTFKSMLGYEDEEFPNVPETWQKLIFSEDLPSVTEKFERHVASHGEEPYYNEVRYRHKNGSTVWVICAGRVVQWTDNGEPVRMVGCHIDITQMHQRLDELVEANLRADTANQAKTAFLANMSHEIRTPLNAIVGLTHILSRKVTDPEQMSFLKQIGSSAQHLLGVISDILDLTKIEAEKLVLESLEFDLDEVATKALTIMNELAVNKGLKLSMDCSAVNYQLRGDPLRFNQALLNYISNAIKNTEKGFVQVRIFPVSEQGDKVLLKAEVRDSGSGIPSDLIPKLFSAFEQIDNSITRKHGGTGLGLAITKRLAQLMGGQAGATSVVGQGSTFWFTAWLSKGSHKTGTRQLVDSSDDTAEQILRGQYAGTSLLLVEDEPINQAVGVILLEAAGFKVTVADNGEEALALAKQQLFALVIMDMQMPVMDGLEATRQIRLLDDWQNVPIIAMTANAFAEDRERCLQAGMNDYLSKPFDPANLCSRLLYWLENGARS
ncbi:MAG: CheR family methyltransferase [Methylicorpusculum sp.]|uniref:CheR family methyltransferase n=3 Tax=Methylicorpusculum sp. TaxID=2713644 RepID=UPI00271DC41D|nr:CheR family methyltransferase [Methylicorpusculum sp.]MDO8941245.1 CheR family methyltransferase [Methylicorpusculum sp.]